MTAVHKANIMKLADGLFLESCREVATNYPSIKYNEIIVDNCCMQLVSKPEQFDVMVCVTFRKKKNRFGSNGESQHSFFLLQFDVMCTYMKFLAY